MPLLWVLDVVDPVGYIARQLRPSGAMEGLTNGGLSR